MRDMTYRRDLDMGTEEGWICYNSWRDCHTEALKILDRIEKALEQDEYYGLESDFKELREWLEEPF